jgi:hypothetical protein
MRSLSATIFTLCAFLPFVVIFHPYPVTPLSWLLASVLGLVLAGGIIRMALELKFCMAIATSEGIESYDWLGRLKFAVPYSDLTEYWHSSRTKWRLVSAETVYELPAIEFDDFHRLMVANARKSLRAKRWQTGQLPPLDEVDEPMLDARSWLISFGTLACFITLLALVFKSLVIAVSFIRPLWIRIYQLRDVSGRLRMNSESISVTWLWKCKSMKWSEVQAVFQVQQGGSRCFVVTSEDESIFIPPHIAVDLESMRKLFYSIPTGTLCVNFDDKSKKGYRRRKRKVANQKLEPAIGLEIQF